MGQACWDKQGHALRQGVYLWVVNREISWHQGYVDQGEIGMTIRAVFLTKRRDACFFYRCQNPISYMNMRGHECADETFQQRLFCNTCASANRPYGPYDVNWDVVKV